MLHLCPEKSVLVFSPQGWIQFFPKTCNFTQDHVSSVVFSSRKSEVMWPRVMSHNLGRED